MSEPILKALMQLFALISDINNETVLNGKGKEIVRLFLNRHLNNDLVSRYLKMFEEYLSLYNSENIAKGSLKERKRITLNAVRILAICEQINEELQQKQKIYVLIKLFDYLTSGSDITENELDVVQTVSNAFNIPEKEYLDIKTFRLSPVREIKKMKKVLSIDYENTEAKKESGHIYFENLKGTILFLHIVSTNTYILRYTGGQDLYLNGQNILPEETYVFDSGASIRGAGIDTIYYTEVVSQLTFPHKSEKISFDANNVSYTFRNSENGIHDLEIHEESGRLTGIIGGSGVGKSTTLSILSGSLKPDSGKVVINGYDLYNETERSSLNGIIGFVPQDDLLIEELTVYQNLYYNAKMCLNNLEEAEIEEVVNKIMSDFDLIEIRELKVGNPLNKIISGGQRKRVNIALELLREPTILFVDEPTSGLSSVDSEMVMKLLKEQTYKGRLVIVNIHQPGSEIYKMFDRIMVIDRGGYQIYYGNPSEAIVYFKKHSNHVNPEEDQCTKCGNVDTDQILQIIEAKVIDEHGRPTEARKVTPKEWAVKFKEYRMPVPDATAPGQKEKIPPNNFAIPGLLNQSVIFLTRDMLSKLSDKQYILINLFGSPFLAFLLAYFTKHAGGEGYRFYENENIPAYLFMCVITSLFLGLIISSEEIIKDRKILKRESFLNLSWFSYINSKIMIMFLMSAIQTILFIVIGNSILEIKGMTISYWIVLFTTSCLANLIGLNISSALSSVIAVYIIIPFIIIPQLLFSGVLVKFDKLHTTETYSHEFVPALGDLMPARWSFEALATRQFRNNGYEKHFFTYKMDESENLYNGTFLHDELMKIIWNCKKFKNNADYKESLMGYFSIVRHHLDEISEKSGINPGSWKAYLTPEKFDSETEKETIAFLDSARSFFLKEKHKATALRDSVSRSLVSKMGLDEYVELQYRYDNKSLREMVLDLTPSPKTIISRKKIIRKYEPGYMKATSKTGRAHFFAPIKLTGNLEHSTYWFNISILWLLSIILYAALYFKVLNRIITFISDLRLKQTD